MRKLLCQVRRDLRYIENQHWAPISDMCPGSMNEQELAWKLHMRFSCTLPKLQHVHEAAGRPRLLLTPMFEFPFPLGLSSILRSAVLPLNLDSSAALCNRRSTSERGVNTQPATPAQVGFPQAPASTREKPDHPLPHQKETSTSSNSEPPSAA